MSNTPPYRQAVGDPEVDRAVAEAIDQLGYHLTTANAPLSPQQKDELGNVVRKMVTMNRVRSAAQEQL